MAVEGTDCMSAHVERRKVVALLGLRATLNKFLNSKFGSLQQRGCDRDKRVEVKTAEDCRPDGTETEEVSEPFPLLLGIEHLSKSVTG